MEVLSITDLRKSYGGKAVLTGVDLKVNKGEIIGYIGPNGAGKSTTVKLMLGLEGGYSGKIEIFGEDIATQGEGYKKRIGYIPETAEMYDSLTAQEYLTFVAELYGMDYDDADRKAKAMLEVFGMGDSYHSRISSFSKGMKQKTLIVSSFLHDPDLLFLDEPLTGLDANSVMVFKEILARFAAEGKTIFYSSHIMDVVEKISNRIVLLHGGYIVANGSFEELKSQSQEGTLENIFNQMTGFHEHQERAAEFVSIVKEG
ncbi:ABC transporter ATP-binding protein [Mesobacillus subterraneus]|uniref:ABC transporter ATP-binding protein n=1 Tax=Mesobacillus subterraneus TaxID=285983 RepID=A0A427TRB2_9BACI|nr:ABC transporter ATP-binding protein [Mesobacillus subterraneus]RSD26892.1 ABC transporter ATP-binding protein [Mesobacillus subterraneus]